MYVRSWIPRDNAVPRSQHPHRHGQLLDAQDQGSPGLVRQAASLARALHPTSASWLNQVERLFVDLTEKQIRRGVHRSTVELEQAITADTGKEHRMTRIVICLAVMTLVGCEAYTGPGANTDTSSDLLEAPAGRCIQVGTHFTSQGEAVPIREWKPDDSVRILGSEYSKYMDQYLQEREDCR